MVEGKKTISLVKKKQKKTISGNQRSQQVGWRGEKSSIISSALQYTAGKREEEKRIIRQNHKLLPDSSFRKDADEVSNSQRLGFFFL